MQCLYCQDSLIASGKRVRVKKVRKTCKNLKKKKKKKKEAPRSLGLLWELTLTLRILRRLSSVGDQLRDPKLPPYRSLYRGIATDH